jgi:arylsulfatase
MTISVDGKEVARGRIEKTVPFAFSVETVDVGADHGQPVADDYTSNVFTGGSLNSVLVELGGEERPTDEQLERKLNIAMSKQ